MFKPHYGTCIQCSEKRFIVVKSGHCQYCNRLNKGKKILKSIPVKKKPSGQMAIFDEIWNEREHISEISRLPLHPKGHPQWHWQFSHVLSKGHYKRFKLLKSNVVLMTPEEHFKVTNNTHLCKSDPAWAWYFERYEQLKQQYYDKNLIETD